MTAHIDPAHAPLPQARASVSRRGVLALGAAAGLASTSAIALPTAPAGARAARASSTAVDEPVAALESTYRTRIGLIARDLRTGRSVVHRPDERQPLCSTFKPLAAAVLLRRGIDLDRVVRYTSRELVEWSPITAERRAMTYGELCDAAIRFSDNTAGNLVLRAIGGPRGLTRELRRLGDDVTRLDRWETELNAAVPGDERDTSTPEALAATYARLLVGGVLRNRGRWVLRGWMQSNTTSVGKFRAGLPASWWCADKTGAGSYGTMNDAGLITTPDGTEIVFAALTRASSSDPGAVGDAALMSDLASLIADRLG